MPFVPPRGSGKFVVMKILVLGAGAVGGYFGGRLAAAGHEVFFTARGEHLKALQNTGLSVQSCQGDFHTHPAAAEFFEPIAGLGLILICVKHKDTAALLPQLKKQAGETTVVISLQNGADSERFFIDAAGAEKVVGGIAYIGAALEAPGKISHTARGVVTIGELGGTPSRRTETIKKMFEEAGIKCNVSANIKKDKWEKLMWNAGFNGICALTRQPVHPLLNHPPTRAIIKKLMEELVTVAHAAGAPVNPALPDKYIENTLKGGEVYPSTLQDVNQGKTTEIGIMNGTVVEEGKKHGIATPYNEMVWAAVSAIDAAAEGRRG